MFGKKKQEDYNLKKLRKDLIDHYEDDDPYLFYSAEDVVETERADQKTLLKKAKEAGIDVKKYKR